MNRKQKTELSKILSLMLRHNPNEELSIRSDGFTSVEELLDCNRIQNFVSKYKVQPTISIIKQIVEENDKQRFTIQHFNYNGNSKPYIRANQGHSFPVEHLELKRIFLKDCEKYPLVLHGTSEENYAKIVESSFLKPMGRQHIHLANGYEAKSGMRKNCEVVLEIDMKKAIEVGINFYESANGVILANEPICIFFLRRID